jgi:methionyl aminopeptidase
LAPEADLQSAFGDRQLAISMPIVLKSRRELEMMRRAGKLAHDILALMREHARVGVTTAEINEVAREALDKAGAIGLSKNYPTYKPGEGYPAETCISVNEEVVHGIPGPRKLLEGDVVTLDLALMLDGYCVDTAVTVPVGQINAGRKKLLDVTEQSLTMTLEQIKPGKRWSDIARLMQYHIERHGFQVVREFVGHGVGRSMHEDPKVPNFVTAEQLRSDFRLKPGMTLAIEPMVVMGKRDVVLLEDQWTVITADHQAAAHFEHTIAVTDTGVDVLTNGKGLG